MKTWMQYISKLMFVISLSTLVLMAETAKTDSLDGKWQRIAGGSSKIMTVEKNAGNFNVKWMDTHEFIKDIHSTGSNTWSCKMIHNKGPELFWETGQIKRSDNKLYISDKYSKHTFKKMESK